MQLEHQLTYAVLTNQVTKAQFIKSDLVAQKYIKEQRNTEEKQNAKDSDSQSLTTII